MKGEIIEVLWVRTHQGPPRVAMELLQKLLAFEAEEALWTRLLSQRPHGG